MEKTKVKNVFTIAMIVFYLLAAIMLLKGYDKMTNYENSEYYGSELVNSYVGGDAYNYIINGNYSTGFFVLFTGFAIMGTIFLVSGLIISMVEESEQQKERYLKEIKTSFNKLDEVHWMKNEW